MIRSIVLLLAALLVVSVQADDYYTYFTLEDGGNVTCSGNYIESAVLELDCDDAYCPLGTTVTLSGDGECYKMRNDRQWKQSKSHLQSFSNGRKQRITE